jgi:hypothetical protein
LILITPGKLDLSSDASSNGGAVAFLDGQDFFWQNELLTSKDHASADYKAVEVLHNRAGVLNGLGFDLRASPVNNSKKWIKGFDLGWQYTLFTHIKHSKKTTDTFEDRYPENSKKMEGPKSGWYGATANRFRLGFVASKVIGTHLHFQLGLGSLISVQKQGIAIGFAHAQFPFYLESLLAYKW